MVGPIPSPPQSQGRLAPSPTGGLHVGHARTFLVAWLAARSVGGKLILRIEDIDATRIRAGASGTAIRDLEWLGLDWNDSPFYQSQRLDFYRDALERLKQAELVYPCTCTRADIERAASAPHAEDEGPTYPGTCAGKSARDADQIDRPFAWRFRVPPGEVMWNDLLHGSISIDPHRNGGDFIIARSPFVPSYQLAVVTDDDAMGINQVLRGDDLIPSTPRQILLSRALDGIERVYGHVPLVHDLDGRRLAKRDGSIKLAKMRESGVDPRSLIGWIARSCGWSDDARPAWPLDLLERFDFKTIPTTPAMFYYEQ